MAIYFCSGSYMDLSRKRIIFVTSTSCVFLLEQSSYLFCCTPLLPLTLGGAPPLHPLCTPYHRCCTPRLWRCTPLAPPRTLTGVGLWNITDVLEFPSTLMEQRTLDARGVLCLQIQVVPSSRFSKSKMAGRGRGFVPSIFGRIHPRKVAIIKYVPCAFSWCH